MYHSWYQGGIKGASFLRGESGSEEEDNWIFACLQSRGLWKRMAIYWKIWVNVCPFIKHAYLETSNMLGSGSQHFWELTNSFTGVKYKISCTSYIYTTIHNSSKCIIMK